MSYDDLILEKSGAVATLTLNVPDKMNAITLEMGYSLPLAVDEVAKDEAIRVLIVTGAGRGFCSGADLASMPERLGSTGVPRHFLLRQVGEPFTDPFMKLNKPVIGAINGACVGGGLSLALTCDIRLAADIAKFAVAQVTRALVPDMAMTYLLPRIVGTSKALELMYTGEVFDAAEALKTGIVSRVLPLPELMPAAIELAHKISRQAPIPVELTKKMVYRSMFPPMKFQVDLETWAQRLCYQTEDHRASVQAFLDKKPQPEFQGR